MKMKWSVDLELRDVYGGDGVTRSIVVKTKKMDRRKGDKLTRENMGNLSAETSVREERTEEAQKDVQTFRKEGDTPVLRIGGSHGKLWGAFREAAAQLYALGDPDFKAYKKVMGMLSVVPVWVPLKSENGTHTESVFQILRGGAGAITMLYDVIDRSECRVDLIFPDAISGHVRKLLEQLESMSVFNKRRTTVRILKITET